MKQCPKCKGFVSDSAKFCVKCGFNIKKHEEENSKHFCPECGTEFSGGNFCPECGYDITNDLEPASKIESKPKKKTVKKKEIDLEDFDLDDVSSILDNKIKTDKDEKLLSSFEYAKYSAGGYVIKKFIDVVETNIVLPDSVVGIEAQAFENTSIVSIKLNNGLKFIGKRAFADCKFLENLNIPSTVNRIDDEAFINCEKLKITIPSTVKIKGNLLVKNTLNEILEAKEKAKAKALEEKKKKEAEEKKALEAKKKEEEKRAKELAEIKAKIEAERRKEQEMLAQREKDRIAKEKAEVERKKKEAEEKKALEAKRLEAEKNAKAAPKKTTTSTTTKSSTTVKTSPTPSVQSFSSSFKYSGTAQEVVIPEGVREIADAGFYMNQYVKKVVIPNTVTKIGKNAFKGSNIQEIVIGDNVTTIGEYAFAECKKLGVVRLPLRLKTIERYAFYKCSNLEVVWVKDNLEVIGAYAFAECSKLYSAQLTNTIKSIGDYAFYNTSLRKVYIGYGVSSIGTAAFSTLGTIVEISVSGVNYNFTYYNDALFKKESSSYTLLAYCTASKEPKFYGQVNTKYTIAEGAFRNAQYLREVIFSGDVLRICANSFEGCRNLTSIGKLTQALISIDSNAFAGCVNLSSISISKNTNVASNAVPYNCKVNKRLFG